jgi:hypothetical protein
MTTFRAAKHSNHGRQIVEVFDGPEFIAGIYPGENRMVRIVTKHPVETTTVADETSVKVVTVTIGRLQ